MRSAGGGGDDDSSGWTQDEASDAREVKVAVARPPMPRRTVVGNAMAGVRRFGSSLEREYGWKFLYMAGSTYVGLKGILDTTVQSGQLPYYKSRNIDASTYQDMQTIARIPWGAKGLLGVVSDAWPLLGYHKRYYIVGSAGLATAALCGLAFFPLSVQGAAVCFFMTQLYVALSDLLIEAKYAEMMSSGGKSGAIVTFVWACVQTGSLFGSCFIGPMADFLAERKAVPYLFVFGIPFAAQLLYPTLRGYLPEEKQTSCACKCDHIFNHRATMTLALVQSGCALGIMPLLLFDVPKSLTLTYCTLCFFVLVAGSFKALPRVIAKCNLYMFASSCLSLGVMVLDLWYTASPLCVPGGPQFSQTYYLTFCALVGGVAGIAGVWIFEQFMASWRAQPAFWVTTAVKIGASMVDLALVRRWNVDVGVPDEYAFILGNAMIRDLVLMLDAMPVMVLMGKLCPKDIEATVFAILAGFSNFGANIANVLGAILVEQMGVRVQDASVKDVGCFLPENGWVNATENRCEYDLGADGHELRAVCQYGNLGTAVFLAQCVFPLLTIPLTFVLIPNVRLDGDILNETSDGPTGGEMELPSWEGAASANTGGDAQSTERRGSGGRRRSSDSQSQLLGSGSVPRRSWPRGQPA